MKKILVCIFILVVCVSCSTRRSLGLTPLKSGYVAQPITTYQNNDKPGFKVIPHSIATTSGQTADMRLSRRTKEFHHTTDTYFSTAFNQDGYLQVSIKIDDLNGQIDADNIYISYPAKQTETVRAILLMYYEEDDKLSLEYDYYAVSNFNTYHYISKMRWIEQFWYLPNFTIHHDSIDNTSIKSLEENQIDAINEPVMLHLMFRWRSRPMRFELCIPLSDQQGNKTDIRIPFNRVE